MHNFAETLHYLTHIKGLRELNLSRNHLKDDFMRLLVPILIKTRIETLDLSSNNISDDGILWLGKYLKGNQFLKTLILNYSRFKTDQPIIEFTLAL